MWTVHTSKQQCKDENELIDGMSQDILGHCAGDKRLIATIRFSPQQGLCGGLRRQGQRCKSIHNQVNPQHLHCFKWRVLWKTNTNSHWENKNSNTTGNWTFTNTKVIILTQKHNFAHFVGHLTTLVTLPKTILVQPGECQHLLHYCQKRRLIPN